MPNDRDFDAGKDRPQNEGRPRKSGKRKRRRAVPMPKLHLQLDIAWRIGRTPMLWGPPGVGKTERVRAWASLRKRRLFVVTLSQLDAMDTRGLPAPENGRTIHLRPNFLPDCSEGPCVLFLDEFTNASISVQRAVYELVLDRRIGDHLLPNDCIVICAGNRPEDRAGLMALPDPLTNRLLHLDVRADPAEWIAWADAKGIDPVVTDYITLYPGDLWSGSSGQSGVDSAFATPRSWEGVADLLWINPARTIESGLEELILGSIGPIVGRRFLSFARSGTRVADLERIRLDPVEAPLPPSEESFRYLFAYLSAILQRVLECENETEAAERIAAHDRTIDAIAHLVGRMGPDRGFLFADMALKYSDRARWNTLLKAAFRRLKGDSL